MKFDAWDQLQAEHAEHGVGELIEGQLRSALRPVLGRVPNPRLVGRRTDRWDDDLYEDVLYDFAAFLLEGGRLNAAFQHASDLEHFQMLLRARARQFVSGKLRGTELSNKVKEACEILEADDRFMRTGSGRERRWSLSTGPIQPFAGDDRALRSVAWQARPSPPAKRYRRDTAKASVVISRPDMASLLVAILQTAGGALTKGEFEVVLRDRLGLHEPETVSLSRPSLGGEPLDEILGGGGDDIDDAEVRMLAADVAQLLSLRQLSVLRESYALGRRREEVATALGISHGTVSNELRRAGSVLLQVSLGSRELAARVLEALFHW